MTEAILEWDAGAEAEVRAGIEGSDGQWLVITGERGEIELRDAPYTSWKDDETELWVSDGTGTERRAGPAADAYRLMVEEVSSVLRADPAGCCARRVARDRRRARRDRRVRRRASPCGPRSR